MIKKTIYCIRHPLSLGNIDKQIYKQIPNWNIDLAEQGIAQAHKVASELEVIISKRFDFEQFKDNVEIFTSPFIRAKKLADIISGYLGGITINEDLLLCEKSQGTQDGCNVDKYDERPVEDIYWKRMGWLTYKPDRGESFLDVYIRAKLFKETSLRLSVKPIIIITGHRDHLSMLEMALINKIKEPEDTHFSWKNCEVRKYEI